MYAAFPWHGVVCRLTVVGCRLSVVGCLRARVSTSSATLASQSCQTPRPGGKGARAVRDTAEDREMAHPNACAPRCCAQTERGGRVPSHAHARTRCPSPCSALTAYAVLLHRFGQHIRCTTAPFWPTQAVGRPFRMNSIMRLLHLC